MKNYTKVPNEILGPSQLSIQARYLYCVLLRHCGQDEWCYPGQETLAKELRCTPRYVRELLSKLYTARIVYKKRKGFNRSNNYKVAKSLEMYRNSGSPHLGSKFPLHEGNPVPPNSTYLKGKDKRSLIGLEKMRRTLIEKKIISR